MDYNNQSPYGQNSGTDPYGANSGTNPYTSGQDPYGQGGGQQGAGSGNPYYQQNPYQQAQYQGYQGYQGYQYNSNVEEPMSVKEWLIVDLLLLIPCVNIIMVFVWAFSNTEKRSKSNYFKAQLIFAGCMVLFYFLLFLVAFSTGLWRSLSTVFYWG